MKLFTLYGTSACHLCDQAQAMLEEQRSAPADWHYEKVDISESEDLFERYGLLIPVLRHPDARELSWPFSERQLRLFLSS